MSIQKCVNSFDEAAEVVAKDFIETMKEEGFETFGEMSRCYQWTIDDIKSEVHYILSDTNCDMWDDGSTIELGSKELEWRKFYELFKVAIQSLLHQ